MVKEIIKDEEILSKPCEKATIDDLPLVQDLLDTADSMEDVAGLAANQIGETKCVGIYLDDNDEFHPVFNPRLIKALYPVKVEEECFSVDGVTKVTRYDCATIAYEEPVDGKLVSRKREFHGRESEIMQHLIDHCKGKVI